MTETVDIQKVISTSTSNVSLDDLTKKGFKRVKVLNQAIITRLIGEAVDRVLFERSKEIGKEEREKVIKEAQGQFETLAKKRLEKERTRIEDLEHSNQLLTAELESLKKRLSDTAESHGELSRHAAEANSLRERLVESEKRMAQLEGQLAAKNEEIQRTAAQGGGGDLATEKILAAINDRLQKVTQPAEVSQIMLSLDGLSRRLSNLSSLSGSSSSLADSDAMRDFSVENLFAKDTGEAIESNVSKVKVKQAKAGDVKGALAKLKKLQKGGEDGE
jgi:predicted RNase H-like nuclease (RuvC/YqgF family)